MKVEWDELFVPDTPILETLVRGSLMFLGLFVLLRVILKRQTATLGIPDLLVVVLIADAAQNGMAGDYRSIADGLLLVATIMLWSLALDWLGFRIPRFQRFVDPPSLLLVDRGRMLRANMRKELITEEELMRQLRLRGVERLEEVGQAYLEGDAGVSVIRRRDEEPDEPSPVRRRAPP